MKKAKISIIFSMITFGTIGIFVKNIALSSSEIALYRGLFGSLFLLGVLMTKKDSIPISVLKKNAWALFFSGAAIGINWILLFESYRYTTISNATLSYYVAPIIVVVVSASLFKEKLTFRKFLCAAAAMLGMFLIVNGGGSGLGGPDHLKGIGLALSAAVFYASVILVNRFVKELSGLQSTFIQLSVASIVLLPYVLTTQGFHLMEVDRSSFIYLLILGVVHTGIAYALFFSAIPHLKSQTTAMLSYIDPASAVFFSAVFIKEEFSLLQFIGGVLVLGASFISETKAVSTFEQSV